MVLVLVGAYRSLGGATPRSVDSAALLGAAADGLRASLTSLGEALSPAADSQPSQQAVTARDGRRRAAAAQQILDTLPSERDLSDRDAAARALLAAAAEDSSWAWRMIAAGVTSPGVTIAVAALRDHAADCCSAADELLLDAAVGEPGNRP